MAPKFERREFARRDFIAGALATGVVSAVATYLAPGGRVESPVTISFVTGTDRTGARDLLVSMWNRANPRARVVVDLLEGSTTDQRDSMISRCKNGTADVLNLDIIDIPYFQHEKYISPVELDDVLEFFDKSLMPSRLGKPDSPVYWAAPFNADVGMMFERLPADPVSLDDDPPALSVVVDQLAADRQFVGQLAATSSISEEAFVVNVLEHALSRNPRILDATTGMPVLALEDWRTALAPLRRAVAGGWLRASDTEETTREVFRTERLSYMRNWPVHYRELQQDDDRDSRSLRIRVGALRDGVLGGQSLAVASNSRQAERAAGFVRFLTGEPAQKILASYGLAATRKGAYEDPSLKAFIPHLGDIRGAIEDAHPRPISRRYREFSTAVVPHLKSLLSGGPELPTAFIEDMRKALA